MSTSVRATKPVSRIIKLLAPLAIAFFVVAGLAAWQPEGAYRTMAVTVSLIVFVIWLSYFLFQILAWLVKGGTPQHDSSTEKES